MIGPGASLGPGLPHLGSKKFVGISKGGAFRGFGFIYVFLTSYYVCVKKSSLRLKNLCERRLIREGMISWMEWMKSGRNPA